MTQLDKYTKPASFQELEEGKLKADEFRKQLRFSGRRIYYGGNQTGMAGLFQRSESQ